MTGLGEAEFAELVKLSPTSWPGAAFGHENTDTESSEGEESPEGARESATFHIFSLHPVELYNREIATHVASMFPRLDPKSKDHKCDDEWHECDSAPFNLELLADLKMKPEHTFRGKQRKIGSLSVHEYAMLIGTVLCIVYHSTTGITTSHPEDTRLYKRIKWALSMAETPPQWVRDALPYNSMGALYRAAWIWMYQRYIWSQWIPDSADGEVDKKSTDDGAAEQAPADDGAGSQNSAEDCAAEQDFADDSVGKTDSADDGASTQNSAGDGAAKHDAARDPAATIRHFADENERMLEECLGRTFQSSRRLTKVVGVITRDHPRIFTFSALEIGAENDEPEPPRSSGASALGQKSPDSLWREHFSTTAHALDILNALDDGVHLSQKALEEFAGDGVYRKLQRTHIYLRDLMSSTALENPSESLSGGALPGSGETARGRTVQARSGACSRESGEAPAAEEPRGSRGCSEA